jgi:hypothetical protein
VGAPTRAWRPEPNSLDAPSSPEAAIRLLPDEAAPTDSVSYSSSKPRRLTPSLPMQACSFWLPPRVAATTPAIFLTMASGPTCSFHVLEHVQETL